MRIIILTTDKSLLNWNSLGKKMSAITNVINTGKGVKFNQPEIKYINKVPKVVNGRISHNWLKNLKSPYFADGYDIIALHSSEAQWRKWGVVGIRGANPNRNIEMEDFYFSSNEHSLRKGLNRFIQVFLHEFSHSYYDHVGGKDKTHEYHDTYADISGLFKELDWSKYQPVRMNLKKQVSLYTKVVELLKKLVSMEKKPGLQPLVERKANLVVMKMRELGQPVRIVEGYRSLDRQNKLYNQGRITPGNIVTNAKPGESFHNYGVAVDFVFRKEGYNALDEQWELLGLIGKSYGFEWGGDWEGFVDRPHFEMKLGYTLKDFQQDKVNYADYS